MNLSATASPGSPAASAPAMSRAKATAHVRLTCARAPPAAPRSRAPAEMTHSDRQHFLNLHSVIQNVNR